MGLDFIKRTAKSYHKGLDERRVELGTPDLFNHSVECGARSYAALVSDNHTIREGEVLGVRAEGKALYAFRDFTPVAKFISPPNELRIAVQESFGEAWGKVEHHHDQAGVVEINVC